MIKTAIGYSIGVMLPIIIDGFLSAGDNLPFEIIRSPMIDMLIKFTEMLIVGAVGFLGILSGLMLCHASSIKSRIPFGFGLLAGVGYVAFARALRHIEPPIIETLFFWFCYAAVVGALLGTYHRHKTNQQD